MERAERVGGTGLLLKNQPYDESLEVDGEEVQSLYSPSPSDQSRRRRHVHGLMLAGSGSEESEEEQRAPRRPEEVRGQPGVSPAQQEEEEEEEEEESDEEESDEEEEEPGEGPEGAYDPADYINLPVNTEVKELFQYITRYTPQCVELDHSLKPFIPDFIPAVGDIDAFLKVPRPDGRSDGLGLVVLDEPSVKQSDPTVQSLWLSEESKQHAAEEMKKVSSVRSPQAVSRAVDSWVDSISALHRSKPAASVQYGRAVPDIDTLMEEWPAEVEELLGRVGLPPARLACSLQQYAQLLCTLLDIPVYCSRLQALHLLFSLYLEFRDSQHFTRST